MFDIGFQEMLMVSVLALLIMGPERLPGAIRTGSLWLAKIRRSFADMKQEIENEVGINANDINLQLHNERVLKSIEENKKHLQEGLESITPELDELEKGLKDFSDYAASEATPPPSSKAGQQVAQAKKAAEEKALAESQSQTGTGDESNASNNLSESNSPEQHKSNE